MSAPPNAPLLNRVREPADSRNLSAKEFKQIAAELRAGRHGHIHPGSTLFEEMGFCYVADHLRIHS
jgi:hemerythrin